MESVLKQHCQSKRFKVVTASVLYETGLQLHPNEGWKFVQQSVTAEFLAGYILMSVGMQEWETGKTSPGVTVNCDLCLYVLQTIEKLGIRGFQSLFYTWNNEDL